MLSTPPSSSSPPPLAPTVGTIPCANKSRYARVDTTTDAVVKYDNTLLSVDSVTYGAFYETVLHNDTAGSSLFRYGGNPGKVVTGTGILATVNFKRSCNGSPRQASCVPQEKRTTRITKNDTNSSDIWL